MCALCLKNKMRYFTPRRIFIIEHDFHLCSYTSVHEAFQNKFSNVIILLDSMILWLVKTFYETGDVENKPHERTRTVTTWKMCRVFGTMWLPTKIYQREKKKTIYANGDISNIYYKLFLFLYCSFICNQLSSLWLAF